ncbi:hypothetical protein SDRG_05295 [Saprolegnia diclina VS20]|uniref:Uncharacterized protein n=1 Tax=Saprolegnia diclina (strain VS20) TaxID=1156394 RepID=T0RWZ2_SAPDV|nr:hypothetical protein SDRG_05295 [Saprolegnia diclina VS20]EQC37068.1 hypothetical protein SDRG_05295 [Saprolegnia diclina VS20]|eukprot:XP_008609230.1 hypothetical protein SDRG_05295 [Saprolegnia diclina VS20]
MATQDEMEALVAQLQSPARNAAILTVCHAALVDDDGDADGARDWARTTVLDTLTVYAKPDLTLSVTRAPMVLRPSLPLQQRVIKETVVRVLRSASAPLPAAALQQVQTMLEAAPRPLFLEVAPLVALQPALSHLAASFEARLRQDMHDVEIDVQWQLWARWPRLWQHQLEKWLVEAHRDPFCSMRNILLPSAPPFDAATYSTAMYLVARRFVTSRLDAYPTVRTQQLVYELYSALPAAVRVVLDKQPPPTSATESWLFFTERPARLRDACASAVSSDAAIETLARFYGVTEPRRRYLHDVSRALVTPDIFMEWMQSHRVDVLHHALLTVQLLCVALMTHPTTLPECLQCMQYILQLQPPSVERRTHQIGVLTQVLDAVTWLPTSLAAALRKEVGVWVGRMQYDVTTRVPDAWLAHIA